MRDLDSTLLANSEKLKIVEALAKQLYARGGQEKDQGMTQPISPVEPVQKFSTGAVRSERMLRYDLIPKVAIDRLADRFTGGVDASGKPTGGARKYGENNWRKGLPTSDVINHVINHLTLYMDYFQIGLASSENAEQLTAMMRANSYAEDDLAGAMWGISVLMYQEEHGMFFDDLYKR